MILKRDWFFNPVAATEVRALLRDRKWVYGTIIFTLLGAVGVVLTLTMEVSVVAWLGSFPGILFLLAEVVALAATAARVQSRRSQRTLDELLTTRMPPEQILGGLVTPGWVTVARPLVVGAVLFALTPGSQWNPYASSAQPWHVYVVSGVSVAGTVFAWSLLGAVFGARHKNLGAAVVRLLLFVLVAKVLFTSLWIYAAGLSVDGFAESDGAVTAGWNVARLVQPRSLASAFGFGWYCLIIAQQSVAWGLDEPGALVWTALVITLCAWQFRRAARRLGRSP